MAEPIYDYDPAQAVDGVETIAVFIADSDSGGGEPALYRFHTLAHETVSERVPLETRKPRNARL